MKKPAVQPAHREGATPDARGGLRVRKGRRKRSSRLPAGKRIADIIAAARILITETGYESTSMLAIAERAGVAEGTLYRFFSTKQQLMVRVAEAWLEELLQEDLGLQSIRGTWNRLRHLVWRVLRLMQMQPAVSRFVLVEMRPAEAYRATRLFKLTRRFTADIRSVCEEAIRSGEFRDDVSPSLLRDMVFGCIEHQTWAYLRGQGDFQIDAVADGITQVIYRGMAVPPAVGDGGLERVVQRLEKAALSIERGRQA